MYAAIIPAAFARHVFFVTTLVDATSAMLLGTPMTSCDGPLLGQICPYVGNVVNKTDAAATLGVPYKDILAKVSLALLSTVFGALLLIVYTVTSCVKHLLFAHNLPDNHPMVLAVRDQAQALKDIPLAMVGAITRVPPIPYVQPGPVTPQRRSPAGPATPRTGPGQGYCIRKCDYCQKTVTIATRLANKNCPVCKSAGGLRKL